MTEEKFYREKIFNKVSINQIKRQFPRLTELINLWYKSEKYRSIQDKKNFLANKLKQVLEEEGENCIHLTGEQLYLLYQWYTNTPKVCYYCSLPQKVLDELHNQTGHVNKRYPKRGKSLEIDRKQPHLPYTQIENLALACYWCNNAKTDTFTELEFLQIGRVLKGIWEQRLNRIL